MDEHAAFIKEYEKLGHLTKINRPLFRNFIPHNAVFREGSETTPLLYSVRDHLN